MDGGKHGQIVKVCADPTCRVHHPNTPSPRQVEQERAEERKRIEKETLAITSRHRILPTIFQRVSAPLKKDDLLAVAPYLIGHPSYSQVPALAVSSLPFGSVIRVPTLRKAAEPRVMGCLRVH